MDTEIYLFMVKMIEDKKEPLDPFLLAGLEGHKEIAEKLRNQTSNKKS